MGSEPFLAMPTHTADMNTYPLNFEENDRLRSLFIRDLTLLQLEHAGVSCASGVTETALIPKTLVRYWHDPSDLPDDVRACLNSWDRLADEGFVFRTFDDVSAASYIANVYGELERDAFARCRHPAMRADYLRMCFVLAEGGIYVDADDVLLDEGWRHFSKNSRLKLQPLCYDVPSGSMMPAAAIWETDLSTEGRIFYVNNDPIAAPANHPVLRRALTQATQKLLANDRLPEIQSTTGPGNLTAALAAHARELIVAGAPLDFELLHNWESIAETRWELSYRGDHRNWRNIAIGEGCGRE